MKFICVGGNETTNMVFFLCREPNRRLRSHPGLEPLQIVTPHLLQYVLKRPSFALFFFWNLIDVFSVVVSRNLGLRNFTFRHCKLPCVKFIMYDVIQITPGGSLCKCAAWSHRLFLDNNLQGSRGIILHMIFEKKIVMWINMNLIYVFFSSSNYSIFGIMNTVASGNYWCQLLGLQTC